VKTCPWSTCSSGSCITPSTARTDSCSIRALQSARSMLVFLPHSSILFRDSLLIFPQLLKPYLAQSMSGIFESSIGARTASFDRSRLRGNTRRAGHVASHSDSVPVVRSQLGAYENHHSEMRRLRTEANANTQIDNLTTQLEHSRMCKSRAAFYIYCPAA
jgi:hypothetical protein